MLDSTNAAFLRTIMAAPDEDTPRLVYADYLEEHGQAERAEFIRLQCELTQLPSFVPRYRELQAREQDLLIRHQVEWKNDLPIFQGVHWEAFERGFVACVRIDDPSLFFTHAPEIFESTPIQRLRLHGVFMTEARRLARVEELRRVRTLDLEDGNRVGNMGLEAMAASPYLKGLEQLKLRNNVIAPAGTRSLAQSPIVERLLLLDLDGNQIFDEGAQVLAASPRLKNLALLSLGWTRIGNTGASLIARSDHLNRLSCLHLTGNDIDDEGLLAIAAATHLTRMRALYLANNRVGDEGAIALASSTILKNMHYLYLKNNRIGDEGAFALAASPYLTEVRELILGENPIGAEAADALRERFGKNVWLW